MRKRGRGISFKHLGKDLQGRGHGICKGTKDTAKLVHGFIDISRRGHFGHFQAWRVTSVPLDLGQRGSGVGGGGGGPLLSQSEKNTLDLLLWWLPFSSITHEHKWTQETNEGCQVGAYRGGRRRVETYETRRHAVRKTSGLSLKCMCKTIDH